MSTRDCALIGVDWGISRLRAFRIGTEGQILERRRNDNGIAQVRAGDFESVLRHIVAGWPSHVPILMCGMIGSRQGWQEVPYRCCPVRAADLAKDLSSLTCSDREVWIVGGLSTQRHQQDSPGRFGRMHYDVMRGEETQIFGAALPRGDIVVITPGTHSKWATVKDATIEQFRTSLTGEMYALLREHSLLGSLMQEGIEGQHDAGAFLDGVHWGLEESSLLHALFSVRTQTLFAQKAKPALASYLSGILIGSEVCGERRHCIKPASVMVIASRELGRLYQVALSAAGFAEVRLVDAEEAVATGLWRLWRLRGTSP